MAKREDSHDSTTSSEQGAGERATGRDALPSELMRKLRPECYSDSSDKVAYQLDRGQLEYHLDTLTNRNQTHDFEIFCRKLCERAICPNLRPSTGPEGGGDSKADTETYAVAEELSQMFFVGTPNSASERWAFAFSAKEAWSTKVRNDVEGIAGTGRNYDRIVCLTSRFARAKTRARIEDELKAEYGIHVDIHDRNWIVEEVIEKDRRDLAFNYLGAGAERPDTGQLGPNDYSRTNQLASIEEALSAPENFRGIEFQMVSEALVAAQVSRNLEQPRVDVDGRFERARRLARRYGSHRQRLKVEYEIILTAFSRYDDFELLNSSYEDFEQSLLPEDHVKNVQYLSGIGQLLVVSVVYGHLTLAESQLVERSDRLRRKLEEIAQDEAQPNSALEALTLLLLWKLNMAHVLNHPELLPEILSDFRSILESTKPLAEYEFQGVEKLIRVAGQVAGSDPEYSALVEALSAFICDRRGRAEGARLLVQRANQLDFDQRYEMIRLLGKALRGLGGEEFKYELIDALKLLSLAYRSAGLLWAARATCLMALAITLNQEAEEIEIRNELLPILKYWVWVSLELCHLPDMLSALHLLIPITSSAALSEEDRESLTDEWQQFDGVLACRIMNCTDEELSSLEAVPDLMEGYGLHLSRMALLYSLGHEERLVEEGFIEADRDSDSVRRIFSNLSRMPASKQVQGPLVGNFETGQTLETRVLGLTVRVHCSGTEASLLLGEAVAGAVEAFFSTAYDLEVAPHTETFDIEIMERDEAQEPSFHLDSDLMSGEIVWPSGRSPSEFNFQNIAISLLMEVAGSILSTACFVPDVEATMEQLCRDQLVMQRIVMFTTTPNSYHRIFDRTLSRLQDQVGTEDEVFTRRERPSLREYDDETTNTDDSTDPLSHKELQVRSVISVHLWDRARWSGAAFFEIEIEGRTAPVFSLIFFDRDAAIRIFEQWRRRFGREDLNNDIYLAIIKGVSTTNPAHYKVLVSSPLSNSAEGQLSGRVNQIGRFMTVTAEQPANLERFLQSYRRSGYFLFAPSVLEGESAEPIVEVAILKNSLSIRDAKDILPNDVETLALPERYKPPAFEHGA